VVWRYWFFCDERGKQVWIEIRTIVSIDGSLLGVNGNGSETIWVWQRLEDTGNFKKLTDIDRSCTAMLEFEIELMVLLGDGFDGVLEYGLLGQCFFGLGFGFGNGDFTR
jgi:hypothetical protein